MTLPPRPYAVADFADKLKLRSAPFLPWTQEEGSHLGSGEFLTVDLGPTLYQAECETAPMSNAEAMQLMSLIESLGGSKEKFYLYDPMQPYPQADPTGALLGAATPTLHTISADRRGLRVTGLPAGYVLTQGDYLAVDYGAPTRRALVRVAETVTASSGGLTPLFAVSLPLRPGIVTGLAVQLRLPAAKVKMVPGSLSLRPLDTLNAIIGFTARQTLAAG